MQRIAVLGATSWGCTLAWLASRAGAEVSLLVRTPEEALRIGRERAIARLPALTLPPSITVLPAHQCPPDIDGLVLAVPTLYFRESLAAVPGLRHTPVLSAAKGLETGTGLRMSEVIRDSGWEAGRIAALSGPNLAHEVAAGRPAAAVVAAAGRTHAEAWQKGLSTPTFRVYTSPDVVGVELAGALKNVIAIAAGVASGLGFGTNTVAALVTRGLAEITRLGVACGARVETFLGLAGVGDLTATCFSPLSRNRRFGEFIARGHTPAEALAIIAETVEGAATAPVALALAAARHVDVPITDQVADLLAGRTTVAAAMRQLLSRELTAEA